jgi:hypothetical protein
MKRILVFLFFSPFFDYSQGMISYNTHVATSSGFWNDCNTWNNPIRIYSSREKKISNGVIVTQNLPFVASNKISFEGNGKLILSGANKISFTENKTPINCSNANAGIIDNVIVNFSESLNVKSQTGFLAGLGGNALWGQNPHNNLPIRSTISELKPKIFRQGDTIYYQESYDLSKTISTPGRVHMLASSNWINIREYPPYEDIRPSTDWTAYENSIDNYFNWGYNNGNTRPGIVWECWNEPDGTSLEPNIPRPNCLISANPTCVAGDETIDYWPFQARQNFYEIYKRFHQRLRASNLPQSAQIAGPSIGYFNKAYLKEFFDYCLANNLQVNVVTWHEINWPSFTKPYTQLKEHVDYVRNNFKDNPIYSELKIRSIEINETITPFDRNNPAGILASINALETAGIDYACKSCWETKANGTNVNGRSSCNDNSLNDLYTVVYMLNSDGSFLTDASGLPKPYDDISNPNKPKSAWWVYKLYGDGVEKRVKSYNEEGRSVVLASKPFLPTIPFAQVLFGYVKRAEDDAAASYLPDAGIYKIRLNKMSSISSSAYYKITINKIPYNDILDGNGRILQTDNLELLAPEFVTEDYLIKDSFGGISYDFYAEKENLYQMKIKSLTKNEYLLQNLKKQKPINILSDEIIIYPNPTNSSIVINDNENSTEKFNYQIFDLTGRIIQSGNSEFNKEINIENFTSGNYIIQIQKKNGIIINKKLIKN